MLGALYFDLIEEVVIKAFIIIFAIFRSEISQSKSYFQGTEISPQHSGIDSEMVIKRGHESRFHIEIPNSTAFPTRLFKKANGFYDPQSNKTFYFTDTKDHYVFLYCINNADKWRGHMTIKYNSKTGAIFQVDVQDKNCLEGI